MPSIVVLRSTLHFEFLLKTSTPAEAASGALEECNDCLLEDFGPGHRLEPKDFPDLLVLCRDEAFEDGGSKVVGLLTLHHTESTRAWELGTMSARKSYAHNVLFQLFMEHVPGVVAEAIKDDTRASWIVKRVAQRKKVYINRLKQMGFEEPAHFMIGVLSDEGYIPFDPFDEVLLKLRVLPPALAEGVEQRVARSIVFDA